MQRTNHTFRVLSLILQGTNKASQHAMATLTAQALQQQILSQHEFSNVLKESRSKIDRTDDPEQAVGLPYPQGCIQWCSNEMILAAGGAGPTKAGLASGFEILQFGKEKDNGSSSSTSFELKRHSWFNTGPDIVYCIVQHPVYPHQFIAGIGNNLVILEIASYAKPAESNAFDFEWNRISKTRYPVHDPVIRSAINTIYVRPNIETTELPDDEAPHCVSKVAVSASGKWIATGGTDGITRLWKYDFVDPKGSLIWKRDIDIVSEHFKFLGRNQKAEEAPPEIERLVFEDAFGDKQCGDSEFLSICNREFAAYIWNLKENKMETVLMDEGNPKKYIFRDVVFVNDGEHRFCLCAVNTVRSARSRSKSWSYLYLYHIPRDGQGNWLRINYRKIMKSDVIRMVVDSESNNVITLHLDGKVAVLDALNLTKKHQFMSYEKGRFFMDIAVSPPTVQREKDEGYLLIALLNDVCVKPVTLTPCKWDSQSGDLCACCTTSCCLAFGAILAVIVGIVATAIQQDFDQYLSTLLE